MDYSRFLFAFAFVIGLIWLVAWAAKRFGLDKKMRGVTGATSRLQLREVLYLDPKRKMLLVRADAREYLLAVSGDSIQLVDTIEVKS